MILKRILEVDDVNTMLIRYRTTWSEKQNLDTKLIRHWTTLINSVNTTLNQHDNANDVDDRLPDIPQNLGD